MRSLQFPDIGLTNRPHPQAFSNIFANGKSRALHQPALRDVIAVRKFPGRPFRNMNIIVRSREHPLCRVQVFHFLKRNYVRIGPVQVYPDSVVFSSIPWTAALRVICRQVLNIPGGQGNSRVCGNTRDRR